jgi:hypothetical protein
MKDSITLLAELVQIRQLAAALHSSRGPSLKKDEYRPFADKLIKLDRKFVELFLSVDFEEKTTANFIKVDKQVADNLRPVIKNGVVSIESIDGEPAVAKPLPDDEEVGQVKGKPAPESIDLSDLEKAIGNSETKVEQSEPAPVLDSKPARKGMVKRVQPKD